MVDNSVRAFLSVRSVCLLVDGVDDDATSLAQGNCPGEKLAHKTKANFEVVRNTGDFLRLTILHLQIASFI